MNNIMCFYFSCIYLYIKKKKKKTIQYLSANYLTYRTVKYNIAKFRFRRFWRSFNSGHTLNTGTKIPMGFDIGFISVGLESGPFSYPVIAQQTWLFVQYRGSIDKWNNVHLHHLWG